MKENVCVEKSFEFAVRVVNLSKYLTSKKKEYVLSKQLLRAGTSIGANVSEAQRAQSKADFTAKIRLLNRTDYLDENEFESMHKDISELISILISICKTASTK